MINSSIEVKPVKNNESALLTVMSCCSLFCRCYNYWFWVPLVAPLVGGVFGSLMYLIFIDWQLPDPDQLERISTISEKLAKKEMS